LSRQLTSASSPYALSNRLVNGIVYLCRQRSNQQSGPNKNNNNNKDTSVPNGEGNAAAAAAAAVTDPNSTALTLAKLAFCVLVQVPLECCEQILQSSQQEVPLSTVQKYLGSYKGTMPTTDKASSSAEGIEASKPKNDDDAQIMDERVNQLVDGLAGMGSEESVSSSKEHQTANIEESSLNEVWATESDPSDYDYGEGLTNDTAQFPQSPEIVDMLDPVILSQQDSDLTLDEARIAIGSLLQQANYSLFAPLFQLSTKQVETYISQLTQLLLLLLQPPQSILLLSNDRKGEEETSFSSLSSSPLQDAMLIPLWILRDAALHHPSKEHSFYTSSYMEVLQTLLAVDQAYQSDTNHRKQSSVCSASIVGLSALSSWCCSAQISVSSTTTAILDSMNDLAHVMERASESGYRDNLKHSMTPIVEVLTGITYEERKVQTGNTAGMMIPQTMLNSGFLRQLLVLSLEESSSSSTTTGSLPPYYLDHALWGLCVVYPTVVGKYVARYPGFSTIVRRYHHSPPDTMTSRDCVHSILWNCFAVAHCSDGTQAPQIVWKTKAPSSSSDGGPAPPQATPLTKDECQEVCQKAWVQLCQMVGSSLTIEQSSPKKSLEVVQDWERLLKLVGAPSVVATFQSLISDHATQLETIRERLSQAAAAETADDSVEDSQSKNEKIDDDDERKKTSMSHQQLAAATTRKMLKQYTLFFQGNVRGSSKTD
jgi:hypothetical protein